MTVVPEPFIVPPFQASEVATLSSPPPVSVPVWVSVFTRPAPERSSVPWSVSDAASAHNSWTVAVPLSVTETPSGRQTESVAVGTGPLDQLLAVVHEPLEGPVQLIVHV
jgi:hypothetical protein